jgi:5-enolpyruvylshikimate-3-phosphate synthase
MGNAGTAMRPLTAALAVLGGDFELSGVPRMHERPIGDLVDALRQLGCQIDYLGNARLPAAAHRPARAAPWTAHPVRGDVSSQFLTALLMALPLVAHAGHRDRGGGRADLQALHRNHAATCWRALALRCSATAGSASPFRRAAATSRPGASMSRPMPLLPAIS